MSEENGFLPPVSVPDSKSRGHVRPFQKPLGEIVRAGGVRLASQPATLAALSATIVVGVLVAVIIGHTGLGSAKTERVVLPPVSHINAILAAYAQAASPAPVQPAVQVPSPHVLAALKTRTYIVKSGDTISAIAAAAGVSVETLISLNSITDVRRLSAGTVLKIPSMNGTLYTVRAGDNLANIAKSHGVKLNDILDANALQSGVIMPGQQLFLPGAHMSEFAYRKALGTLFVWPTAGAITSPFGMRRDPFTGVTEFHNGIDIANAMGTPVDAAMSGTVAMVGKNRGYGNFIILDNGNGFQTLYGHLLKWLVQQGETVSAGQEIGEMGSTGYATGPHLHFTIYKDSAPVNPLTYLPKR